MHKEDEALRDAVRRAHVDGSAPPFDRVFAAAERQARSKRRIGFAGLGVAAAVALVAVSLQPLEQQDEFIYLDVAELAASTSWSAPSDSLLPEHQFDIYQEIPWLFESTEPDGGALL